jgi:anti-anti-sigma factor
MTSAPSQLLRVVVRRGGHVVWSGTVDRQTVLIGRSPRADVVLDDSAVSWTHAVVQVDRRAGLTFADRSSNGSYYQDRRVVDVELGGGGVVSIPPFDVEMTLDGWIQESPYVETSRPVVAASHPGTGTAGPKTTPVPGPGERDAVIPAVLHIVQAPDPLVGLKLPLAGTPFTIGRAADCDVRLEPRSVSRYHAKLSPLGGHRWRVQDAGSQNGVEINGRLVHDAVIGFGDRIGFGTEVVAVLEPLGDPAPADPSVAAVVDALVVKATPSTIDSRVVVLSVAGRVDGYSCGYFRDEIFKAIDAGHIRLVADFSTCTFCDHAGLAVLVNAHVAVRQRRGALCLMGLNPQLRDAFVLLRLDRTLLVAQNEADAVARVVR